MLPALIVGKLLKLALKGKISEKAIIKIVIGLGDLLVKSTKNEEIYKSMKTIFGDIPRDGAVYCKICGEFLCSDDFSTFEGFSDGMPTKTNEVLDEKKSEKLLNEKQLENKKRIIKISALVGLTVIEFRRCII